jgi:hypothetical protein
MIKTVRVLSLVAVLCSCQYITGYRGITQTDKDGNVISSDPEDWQADGIITGALFYPNPCKDRGVLRFSLSDYASVTVEIKSNESSVVRTLGAGGDAGEYLVSWDLRDKRGDLVRDGIYRVYIQASGGHPTMNYQTSGDIQISQ